MKWLKNNLRGYYNFIVAFSVVATIFAAASFNNPPLFNNTDNFVLFAQEEIKLQKEVQISSGDLGSNKELDIDKDAVVNGNLFADEIEIDKSTQINGNVSFNKLETQKDAKILGTQTKPVSLPIANLPGISEFQTGDKDFKFEGKDNSLVSGNYKNITLEKDSRLALTGGTYNINKLELKENSALVFNSPTTLNIQFKLKSQEHIAILPGNNNLKPTDLVINYQGKNEKDEQDKDDEEKIRDKEKKEDNKPIEFGKTSFLNFKLLAPQAEVHIGESSTVRGQILARKIKVEKESILSREETFVKESDPTKVVIDTDGSQFLVNEILVNFTDNAVFSDAQGVANIVSGRIVGLIQAANTYQIEVITNSSEELESKIQTIRQWSSPLIEGVFRNYVLSIF